MADMEKDVMDVIPEENAAAPKAPEYAADEGAGADVVSGADKVKNVEAGYYSAVLMDIQMPVMNGYEATRAIRSLPGEYYRTLPIIAMSANAYDEDIRASLDSGMNAHIAKPFQPDDLIKTLCRYIVDQ